MLPFNPTAVSGAASRASIASSSNSSSPGARAQQVSSAADLTAAVRRTGGERPPPLVGCSTTLLQDTLYVFGGRLVPTRTMVNTLYALDLKTLTWTCLWPYENPSSVSTPAGSPTRGEFQGQGGTKGGGPQARYFHSACAWGDKLVVFGGEGYEETPPSASSPASPANAEGEDQGPVLKTLDDIAIWDTVEKRWTMPQTEVKEGVQRPQARYAHLGVVTSCVEEVEVEVEDGRKRKEWREGSVMVVMGGQDIRNTYLHSLSVLDLSTLTWIQSTTWDRHIGTYRAVLTAPTYTVVPPSIIPSSENEREKLGMKAGEEKIQLGYSEKPTAEQPEPLLLFSNFNFTQVRRDLDLLSSPLSSTSPLSATSLSSSMSGPSLPPGLRFPTGTIIGRHLLVFGTFLSQSVNSFSIWALDLGPAGAGGVKGRIERGEKVEWLRIDPGAGLGRGSWNRAFGWGNTVVVLGDRERDIAADYDHRQANWHHVVFVDMECFGVYQPPPRSLPPQAQTFGLLTLSQPFLSDFEIVCSDGKRLACSRKMLVDRWSWLRAKMDEFKEKASGVKAAQQRREEEKEIHEVAVLTEEGAGDDAVEQDSTSSQVVTPAASAAAADDLRLTPRTLSLPTPSSVVQAFLQYLYSLSLSTPLQLHPPILAALLVFAKTYGDAPLRGLCVHALHGVLERDSAAAPLVYEAATVSGCTALQVRALRSMLGNPTTRSRTSQPPTGQGEAIVLSAPTSSAATRARVATAAVATANSTFSNHRSTRPADLGNTRSLADSDSSPRTPRSSRSPSYDPPCSPPPTSPLPRAPPASPRPARSAPAVHTLPCDSPKLRRCSIKPASDSVAEPTPDEVPPQPVPLWSPFLSPDKELPPAPVRRRPRSSKSSSYRSSYRSSRSGGDFDTLPPPLLSDAKTEDSATSDTDTATARESDSVFNSPTKTVHSISSTRATSVRSRSSSVGSSSLSHRNGGKDSFGPMGIQMGWTPALKAQMEEEEPSGSMPASPVKEGAATIIEEDGRSSLSHSSHDGMGSSEGHGGPGGVEPFSGFTTLERRTIPRLSLPTSVGSKSRGKRRESKNSTKHELSLEEHWAPSFFDTVKGGNGSVRNPHSTRKATSLTPELLASFDFEAMTAGRHAPSSASVSEPVPMVATTEAEALFDHPRPAPAPAPRLSFLSPAAATSIVSLVSKRPSTADSAPSTASHSAAESRRHSLDPSAFSLLTPRPPRRPLHRPSPLSSSPASVSRSISATSASTRSSVSSAGSLGLVVGDTGFSSSSGASAGSCSPGLTGGGGADVLIFDPAANETIPLLAASSTSPQLDRRGLPVPSASVLDHLGTSSVTQQGDEFGRRPPSQAIQGLCQHRPEASVASLALSTATATVPTLPPTHSHSHSGSHSSNRSLSPMPGPAAPLNPNPNSKQTLHALQTTLGTQLLRAAGASQAEIRLRARSVGYQVLKKHEEEVKKAKKAGREAPSLGLGAIGTATGALGEYTGGGELRSKFSWD
ncbi:hypothetical protein JCM11641_003906 [Rhodosporidiobolus odoratus]